MSHHLGKNKNMVTELVIKKSDMQLEKNSKNHHTYSKYQDILVIRRGQPFDISLYFQDRGFDASKDKLFFIVETGSHPSEDNGTKAKFSSSDLLYEKVWSASLVGNENNMLHLSINSPPNAPIGSYKLSIEVVTGSSNKVFPISSFMLLFNPWCQEDEVYLEREDFRQEYVLNQHGIIFQGSHQFINMIPWNFGQFEDGILEICIDLLDLNPKFIKDPSRDCSRRGSPVYVSRIISAMVNCNDDRGILFGRWDNNYQDGVNPMTWTGSVDILRKWKKSSYYPVKYGQCWVFAAVACTVLRCLGIPTRVVTNYSSAHDTNANLVIDIYKNEQGETLRDKSESIWNYHCWVESWMKRPDLEPKYNGWQAVDPTPQEKSEGIYCCGPASIRAIKNGEITTKYDTPFIFAEVNADLVFWVKKNDGNLVKMHTYNSSIGLKISTKAVGKDEREDITHHYKYPEGSQEERETFKNANHRTKLILKSEASVDKSLKIQIKGSPDMNKGNDFDVSAVITNFSSMEKSCRLLMTAQTISYNGKLGPECARKEMSLLTLEPFSEKKESMRILYSKYNDHLNETNLMKVKVFLQLREGHDFLLAEREIYLMNPEIKIKILGEPKKLQKLVAEISVKNPLPTPLLGCVFTVEGAQLTQGKNLIEVNEPVEPGNSVTVRVDLMPQSAGLHKLVVNFESDKMKAVKGFRNLIVGS